MKFTYCWVPNRRPSANEFFYFFHPGHPFSAPSTPSSTPLMNYWGKFSFRVWNDMLMLTFLRSHKRNDQTRVCFVLQVRAKKPKPVANSEGGTCFFAIKNEDLQLCLFKLNWSLIMHLWHMFSQILSKHIQHPIICCLADSYYVILTQHQL